MALLESVPARLGSLLPTFSLADADGIVYRSDDLSGANGLLVVVTCNHCPYAQAVWPRVVRLARHAREVGIATVAINPNLNPDYPDDSPPAMKEAIARLGIAFPYLVDRDQSVARALDAQCTPEFYLYDRDRRLAYHGRLDDSWKDESKVTRRELQGAIEALATGRPVDADQPPSMGCSIKWLE